MEKNLLKYLSIIILIVLIIVVSQNYVYAAKKVQIGEKLGSIGKLGDVYKDGKIDSKDAKYVLEYAIGTRYLTYWQRKRADVNQDGKITSADAKLILSYQQPKTAANTVNNNSIVNATNNISIKINGARNIYVGDTIQLIAEITPNNIKNKTIKWETTNNNIAVIDTNGKLTGKSAGNITIKATLDGKTASANIAVCNRVLGGTQVAIVETTKNINNKTNPYNKTNGHWCLNFNGYKESEMKSLKSNSGKYESGAIAVYTIQRMRGKTANKNYLNSSTNANSTYFISGKGTNFNIINYKYMPNYNTYQSFLQTIYNEILAGFPVAVKVRNSANQETYVVAYAVKARNARTAGKLSANDISVIDTSAGNWSVLGAFREFKTPDGKYVLGIHDTNITKSAAEMHKHTNDVGGYTYGFTYNCIEKMWQNHTMCCASFAAWTLYDTGILSSEYINKYCYSDVDDLARMLRNSKKFTEISLSSASNGNLKAGDIVYWPGSHVQIYAGNGKWYNGGSDSSNPCQLTSWHQGGACKVFRVK